MKNAEREVHVAFPEYVRRIISRLGEAGYDAYAVGGCVRDSVIGRVPNDWDVTTSADPHETMRIFADGDIRVIGTAGVRHGTVMVITGDDVCEITTFRSDGEYTDHRRPESVSFSEKVEDDLSRRDFTMNAIAAKPCEDGTRIVDPFSGIGDIGRRIIRTVGDPDKRFGEDALRIMRAVRFTSELGFDVDPDTADAANRLCNTLRFVSAERITTELWRTLGGEYLGKAIESFGDVFERLGASRRFCADASKTPDPRVRLALMEECGSDGREFFSRFRFPGKTASLVRRLLAVGDLPKDTVGVCGLMRDFGDDISTALEYIRVTGDAGYGCLADSVKWVKEQRIPYTLSMLQVNGQDAVAAGFRGSDVRNALEYLLKEVQLGRIANEKTVLELEFSKIKTEKQ